MLPLLMLLSYVEGRVYCQDSHATQWVPLGYSCPINCGNVITALNKLQSLDYIKILSNKPDIQNDIGSHKSNNIDAELITAKDATRFRRNTNEDLQNIKTYKRYYKILNNERVMQDLRNELKTDECYTQNDVKFKLVNSLKRCNRRDGSDDFLTKFTSVLNRYTHSVPFTEELTAIILKKILGRNLDLRHGLIDIEKVINFLNKAIQYHEKNIDRGEVINLKTKHCLSAKIMGCYCMPGFVEKFGQCVMPTDCFEETIEKNLLARIIVH